jgi:hypothetical protein
LLFVEKEFIIIPMNENQENTPDEERISWHPAFFEAIQMELEEYSQYLQFISEFQLTTEPQRIDVLIIRKSKDIEIKKNIASIFRKDNIVEYKSPDDHISVKDFYHVYGYAGIYQSLKENDIKEITLTFMGSKQPRELLAHLEKERGYAVEEKWPGIYIVSGDIMPIQIIDNRKLSEDENLWLRDLDNRLKAPEFRRIADEAQRQGNFARIRAYLDVITRANKESVQEVMMSDNALTLEKIFRDTGFLDKWIAEGKAEGKAEGEERKAAEIAKNLIKYGFSLEKTAELSGLDLAKIKTLETVNLS